MGDHNHVAHTAPDDRFTTWTLVFLARLIRLDRLNHLVGEVPQDVRHVGRGNRLVRHDADGKGPSREVR